MFSSSLSENQGSLRQQPESIQDAAADPGGWEGDVHGWVAPSRSYTRPHVAQEVCLNSDLIYGFNSLLFCPRFCTFLFWFRSCVCLCRISHTQTCVLLDLRGLRFIQVLLQSLVDGEKDENNPNLIRVNVTKAYEISLRKYHGWFVQKLFTVRATLHHILGLARLSGSSLEIGLISIFHILHTALILQFWIFSC